MRTNRWINLIMFVLGILCSSCGTATNVQESRKACPQWSQLAGQCVSETGELKVSVFSEFAADTHEFEIRFKTKSDKVFNDNSDARIFDESDQELKLGEYLDPGVWYHTIINPKTSVELSSNDKGATLEYEKVRN